MLVATTGGGWGLVRHWQQTQGTRIYGRTVLNFAKDTLADLYATICEYLDKGADSRLPCTLRIPPTGQNRHSLHSVRVQGQCP